MRKRGILEKGFWHLASATVVSVISTSFAVHAHSWYPRDCCSGEDCMLADSMYVDAIGDTIVYAGTHRIVVPRGFHARPSPDNQIHVCFTVDETEGIAHPRCLFMPTLS